MLALLLCFVSFTRSTIAYLSSKVFRTTECRSALCQAKINDDMDSPIIPGNRYETEVGDDDVIDDNVFPSVTSSDNTKRRTNSVIDSVGLNDAFIPSGYYTPRQTKSESTEGGSSERGYSNTVDSSRLRKDTTSKRPDATDAHMQSAAVDDDIRGRAPSPVTASMPVEKDAVVYNMNHKNRGRCIIFNHEEFDTGFLNRDGSTADALRIQDTFKNLGFIVEILDNLTYADVLQKITELSDEDHTDNDCICIFILTHGLSNDLVCAKDVAYRSDNLWKPFTADRCKTLAGKPKLFFFHACRGDQLDGGAILSRSTEKTETDSFVASYKIPTHADFLIAHSTVQGFVSWRNTKEGTWYIQCLCDMINECAATMDLLKILTITARKIATEYASYNDLDLSHHDQKQVPSVTSMLIRDLYLTKK